MKKALLFLLCCVATKPAFAEGSVRLERLTMLYQTFEAGYAYQKHCGDLKNFIKDKPNYTANAQMTVTAMSVEIEKQNHGSNRKMIDDVILGQSHDIQAAFDKFYKDKNACLSKAALNAKAHLDQFSAVDPQKGADFIKNIENR